MPKLLVTPRKVMLKTTVLFAGLLAFSMASADTLKVCSYPDNLPFSKAEGPEKGLYIELAEMVAERLGQYPHKAIVFPPPRANNTQRAKAKCSQCGYEVSLLKKWATMGAPICPKDNIRMEEVVTDLLQETAEEEKARKDKEKEIKRAVS